MSSEIYSRSAQYYDLLYGDRNLAGDVRFLEAVFRKFLRHRPVTILDLACGTGAHAIPLGRRGYAVTGLDLSAAQLRLARAKVRGARLAVNFVRGDMRHFDLRRQFGAAICMFGGFGYLLSDRDVLAHFSTVHRHLAPSGAYVFEFWQESAARARHRGWTLRDRPLRLIRLDDSRHDVRRHRLLFDEHHFAFEGGRLTEAFTESHAIRLYRVAEMRELLARTGFRLAATFDGDGERKGFDPVRRRTFRVIAVAAPLLAASAGAPAIRTIGDKRTK